MALELPTSKTNTPHQNIPITYVPARNTIMLSCALGWMEALIATDIFFGANAVDYSGYPDCRPEYVKSFETLANLATRVGVEEHTVRVHAPIISMSKAQIIQTGIALGVDFSQTVSCYQANAQGHACGICESCRLRQIGFAEAAVADPTIYQL
jgi:7-cyano-7-deazaguanine synthase